MTNRDVWRYQTRTSLPHPDIWVLGLDIIEKKNSLFTQSCPKYLWELDIIIPLSWWLWPRKRSQKSAAHILQRLPPSFQSLFFFFFCYRIPHRKCAESAPFWQAEEQIYTKPSRENHQKMGICWISACFLPGFPQTVLASTRVWTLPMPAKSWACSAKCDIAKETGKGCYKVILSPQKNGKSSNKM